MEKISFFSILILSLVIGSSVQAAGASLFLAPPSGTYLADSTFSVTIKVNSGAETINAAEGTLIFNPNELRVISLSKNGSIFSLWTTEPTFSNSSGNIVFGGGAPTSFAGTSGTILTVNFKAEASASAQVSFSSGSVLAADGKGTNILANMNGAVYTLKSKITTPPAEDAEEYLPPPTPDKAPLAPVVSSLTHPEENKWYTNSNPEFSWLLPSDVTDVSLLLHKKPTANPGYVSDGLIESKKFEDIEDGIWYFHVKFKNQYGWGEITHRKVLIDTQPPEPIKLKIDNQGDSTNPTPVLYFASNDNLSGIAYYEIEISSPATTTLTNVQMESYLPSPRSAGIHKALVKAFDEADNFTSVSQEFEIFSIEIPIITKIPISIQTGETLTVEGTARPEFTVRIYIQKQGEGAPVIENVTVDESGNFALDYDKLLGKGEYLVWACSQDERGALSYPTKKYSLEVGLPPFMKIGKIALDYLSTMITLIILIVGAIAVIVYAYYRISLWRKRLRKETKEVAQSVTKAFRALREEVHEQIEYLDKKPGISTGEKKVRDKLQEALNISEEFIGKEVKDIEKELE